MNAPDWKCRLATTLRFPVGGHGGASTTYWRAPVCTLSALPPEVGDGYISLLYKKKDRDDPRNYRPITLLNSDYKILMRVLARRMNEAVVQFVSDTQ